MLPSAWITAANDREVMFRSSYHRSISGMSWPCERGREGEKLVLQYCLHEGESVQVNEEGRDICAVSMDPSGFVGRVCMGNEWVCLAYCPSAWITAANEREVKFRLAHSTAPSQV